MENIEKRVNVAKHQLKQMNGHFVESDYEDA